MPSTDVDPTYLRVGIALVAVLVLAYSLLIIQSLLRGLGIVLFLALVYLIWRFVRALERIAGAMERHVEGGTGGSVETAEGEI